MATITTDTYLDNGTARAAGEGFVVKNGANFIIRTDTRVHANAPASMTGTIGGVNITTSLGGGFIIDGTKVRWMAFDTGSGNVPAIGTTITQGGVSGYLLGVWPNLASAPTAVGSAMPASGFLKFREVTGGQFAIGALTGIGANATEADRTGWIEYVNENATGYNCTNNATIGRGFEFTGDWFYLDDTNGTPGQQIQCPTNGGGQWSGIAGCQVETAPGSGVYEWWTGVYGTGWTTSAQRPTTDARTRLYNVVDGGIIRFGSDGTSNIGYTPPSGCKVRIPNIICRTAQSASRATNYNPGTAMSNTAAFVGNGNFKFTNVHLDMGINSQTTYNVELRNVATGKRLDLSKNRGSIYINGFAKGDTANQNNEAGLDISYNAGSCYLENVAIHNYNNAAGLINFANTSGLVAKNLILTSITSSAGNPIVSTVYNTMVNAILEDVKFSGHVCSIQASTNVTFKNTDYVERLNGDTTTTGSGYIFSFTNCVGCIVDGLTFGRNGTIANTHPRASTGIISVSGGYGHKFRNFGTSSNFLNTGATAGTRPTRIFCITACGSSLVQSKIQRIFVNAVQQKSLEFLDSNSNNWIIEQVYTDTYTASGTAPVSKNSLVKGFSINSSQPSSINAANAGYSFMDFFNSNNWTTGKIRFAAYQPTTESLAYITQSYNNGSMSGFAQGYLNLLNVGEYVIFETPYWVKGHTGFQNVAPTQTGTNTGNFTYQYQIDTGSGYSAWKTLNATNLSAETISPSTGFKMLLKITCATANIGNAWQMVNISTNSTQNDQLAANYVLDTNNITFTGLATGSEVRCYVGTDPSTATEVSGVESTAGSTFTIQHSAAGSTGFITILAMGYQPIYFPYTYKSVDDSILIQPVIDRNYNNPV